MPIAAATGAGGNTTALVGTPEEVAESILRYYDLGVTSILIRGFRPYEDVKEYGREIVPLVQAEVARRDAENAKLAAEPALAAV
jgi:alkanesulfonate monooxygenase